MSSDDQNEEIDTKCQTNVCTTAAKLTGDKVLARRVGWASAQATYTKVMFFFFHEVGKMDGTSRKGTLYRIYP